VAHFNNPDVKIGCKITFMYKSIDTDYDDVSEKVLIRNFGINSLSIAENIATYIAANKALKLWSNK
jgi:hypothetical protein